MAIAGFKRYGIPSLIPGAEVDGIFSAQDSGLFGDDDLIPLMKTLGITDEDVKQFYEDSPGFAVAMGTRANQPTGRSRWSWGEGGRRSCQGNIKGKQRHGDVCGSKA